ncbi:ABC transporter permease [Amaricoccus macauensis]|uniref:ABC transporter permease n=1 Tax=Amaricoccus macauensis TaxID=57001 RepID=UPI003C7AC1A7
MESLIRYAPLLAGGALVTVSLAVISLFLATCLGALGAAGRIGGSKFGKGAVLVYTTMARGIPDLVMILLVYFGGQRLVNTILNAVGGEPINVSTFWAGVVAIGFIYGAYLTETFRGAYQTIPKGQVEAAQALGLRGFILHWNVTIPQLIRFALPGYANVWQVLVKSTAVVSVIGLKDLVGLANDAGKTAREPFIFFVAVLAVYLLITWASTLIFERIEKRYSVGMANAR